MWKKIDNFKIQFVQQTNPKTRAVINLNFKHEIMDYINEKHSNLLKINYTQMNDIISTDLSALFIINNHIFDEITGEYRIAATNK